MAVAALTALLVFGGPSAATALDGAAGGPRATTAKKSSARVGTYRGTTELGGTVSFRFTKKRKIVDFTMPDVPVECVLKQQGGNSAPYSKPPFTITAPPMKVEGVAKFLYEDPVVETGPFQGVHGAGTPDGAGARRALKGNAVMISWNGPAYQVGTEHCGTEYVDWNARKK
jgi:hypothetical protein